MLSLFYSATLTSMCDYWKNHSFDYVDVCWQSDVSAFQYAISVCHSFPSKKQTSSNLITAITVGNDFRDKRKSVTVSLISPFICHEVMGPDAMILVFSFFVLSQLFHFPFLSPSSRGSLLSAFRVVSGCCHIWGCWYFPRQSCFQLVSQPIHQAFCMMFTVHIS